jgi:hypothetical protein
MLFWDAFPSVGYASAPGNPWRKEVSKTTERVRTENLTPKLESGTWWQQPKKHKSYLCSSFILPDVQHFFLSSFLPSQS